MVQIYLHHPSAPVGSNTPSFWGELTKEKLSHAPYACIGVFDSGCLVVNCTGKGKMYLYDLVDIKKEASNPLRTNG